MFKHSEPPSDVGEIASRTYPRSAKSAEADGADDAGWSRVKRRLRTEVGDDIFSSWFARMELEGLEGDGVRLSVPTRFLKSWIHAHYTDRVLACWKAEQPAVTHIDLIVRSAVMRTASTRAKAAEAANLARDLASGAGST